MNQKIFDEMAKGKKEEFDKKCKEIEERIAELEEMREDMLDTLKLAAEAKWDEDDDDECDGDCDSCPEYEECGKEEGFEFVLRPDVDADLEKEHYIMIHYDPKADVVDDSNVTLAIEKGSDWHIDAAALAYALAYLIAAYGEKNLEGLDIHFAAKKAVSAIGDSYLADAIIEAMKKIGENMEDDDDE